MTTASDAARSSESSAFERRLAPFKARLESRLTSWLRDKRVAAVAAGEEAAETVDALADLILAGGKRLRPALVYHTHLACGGSEEERAISLALSTEFLHTYLLIHDDIMDHAEMRRRRPAVHARFRGLHQERGWRGDSADYGEAVAILIGDLCHTYAVEILSRVLDGARRADELRRTFFEMSQEVILGQHLEMRLAVRGSGCRAELERVLRLKSGSYSVERPVQLGAVLANAAPSTRGGLAAYGRAVGEAFQLQDDVLGLFGDSGTLGKPVGADLSEGKLTFLVLHTLERSGPEQRRLMQDVLGRPGLDRAEIERVREIVRDCGAVDAVQAMIEDRLAEARRCLKTLKLEEQGYAFLEGLLGYLRGRRE